MITLAILTFFQRILSGLNNKFGYAKKDNWEDNMFIVLLIEIGMLAFTHIFYGVKGSWSLPLLCLTGFCFLFDYISFNRFSQSIKFYKTFIYGNF